MRFSYTTIFTLFSGALAAPALMTPRQSEPNVMICDGINFTSCSPSTIEVPMNTCINMPDGWNDKLSSFQPSAGAACLLWDANNCQGSNVGGWIVYPGASDLRNQDFNDKTSSFQCKEA